MHQSHIARKWIWCLDLPCGAFCSTIPLCFLNNISDPSWFCIVGYIHVGTLLGLQHIMFFQHLIIMRSCNFLHRFCISGSYNLFICFFKLTLSQLLLRHIFIKGYIPVNFHILITRYIDYEVLGDLTVPNKYSFLSGRIQLGSFLFWYMNKQWITKYLAVTHLWFLSCEHFFMGLESM